MLISLSPETDISSLMKSLQWNLTRNYKREQGITESVTLWQRGFYDHVIRDEDDLEKHMDYIHYNPVKHGHVEKPIDFPHSSFREYVRRGWYGTAWCTDVPANAIPGGFEPAEV